MNKLKVTFLAALIIASCLFASVEGSLSSTVTISSTAEIKYPDPQEKKFVCTVLIDWNEGYYGGGDWASKGPFTPTLGSYLNSDPAVVEQQIKWMDQAGIDVCFITLDYTTAVAWMNLFLSKATQLNSKVQFAAYFNGRDNFDQPVNRVLEGVNNMAAAGIFNHPKYFKWADTQSVISGYLDRPEDGWHVEYWVEVKQQYPNLSIWANGWHPDYWSSLDGVVDAMCVLGSSFDAQEQVTHYSICETHPLSIHVFSVTPGFDNSGIGGTLKLNRNNGQTFKDCWDRISSLVPQPDVIWVSTWNDYGECHGIEPIIASRSTTTGAFGDLYLNLTREYGNLFKSG